MAKAYKCDRCGAYYDKTHRGIRYGKSNFAFTMCEYDLCEKCAEEFETWLKGKRDEEQS